ncbi:MAG: hypothetical protein ACKOBJ_06590 [Actinomycetota bacterium]
MTADGFDVVAADEEILVLEDAPDPDLVLPVWEPTGVTAVDGALERLNVITEAGLHEHPEVFGAIHADLRHVLGDLDSDKT